MLENRKIMLSVEDRENMNAIDRKCYRELQYEMDPYEWTLVKLPDSRTKAVIVNKCNEYKHWRIDDKGIIPEQVIIKKLAIIDSFEIMNGFPKKVWKYCTFTKEQYIKRREEENEYWVKVRKREQITIIPREIIIPRVHMIKKDGSFTKITNAGAYFADDLHNGLLSYCYCGHYDKKVKKYINSPRIAIHVNGDQIKYSENNEIE
jgi:hypothetical protein